jgi:hypothetical protein
MTLLKKSSDLRERIERLRNNQANISETKALQGRLKEVEPVQEILADVVGKIRLLSENKIRVEPFSDQIAKAMTSLKKVQAQFKVSNKSESLTKGKGWSRLIENVESTGKELGAIATGSWNSYLGSLSTGQSLSEIENTLAKTNHNSKILVEYRELYLLFRDASTNFPIDRDDIEKIGRIVEKLLVVWTKFDLDVPDSVKSYLDSVALGGANLNLLTDEVIEWLQKNGSFNNYKIVSR